MDRFLIKQARKRDDESQPSTSQTSEQSTIVQKEKKAKHYSFQEEWEVEFFVVENSQKTGVVCLLCQSPLTGFRRSNCERHLRTNHPSISDLFPTGSNARMVKLQELKNSFRKGKQMIARGVIDENAIATLISLEVSKLIVKHSKPVSDGEIIKECIIKAVQRLTENLPDSQKKRLVSTANNIPLSRRTVTRRVEDIAMELKSNLMKELQSCLYMSLAVDESVDIGGIPQLLCYVRFVHDSGCVGEEFLCTLPLHERTTGEDIFSVLKMFLEDNSIEFKKIISLATDGAPSMVGKHKGLISYFSRLLPNIIHYHCFIHVEVLCSQAQVEEVQNVLNIIVKLINFLIAKPLTKRLLKLFLEEMQAPHSELVMHTDVRWLSKGKALFRMWEVFDEVKAFLSEKYSGKFLEIFTQEFKTAFSFSVDLLNILNKLNLDLQGRNKMICDLYDTVTTFQMKMSLFATQIKEGKLHHLPELKKTLEECSINHCPNYVMKSIESLSEEFQKRFVDLKNHTERFQMCSNPFSVDVNILKNVFSQESIPAAEMELIEMQCSTALKLLHKECNYESFWKSADTRRFPLIRQEALKVSCLFGTTYVCEAAFSFMNNIKNKKRARISHEHLDNCLRVALSNTEEIDLEKLVHTIQSQGSH